MNSLYQYRQSDLQSENRLTGVEWIRLPLRGLDSSQSENCPTGVEWIRLPFRGRDNLQSENCLGTLVPATAWVDVVGQYRLGGEENQMS